MTLLTEQEIDWLALEGCEIMGFKSGAVVPYDVAGYDRTLRLQVPPGTLPTKDISSRLENPFPPEAHTIDEPYLVRISGFRREKMFGPDEIGADIQKRGIAVNDGLGNGLYESLLIDRKYGLHHCLEAPLLGYRLPFLEHEWQVFIDFFPKRVAHLLSDLRDMEAVYGGNLADRGERFMILWCRQYPLALFIDASERDPEGVKMALKAATGYEKPPIDPQTSQERLGLVKFWQWIRAKQAEVISYQAEVLREMLGDGLKIIANPHELPPLDMHAQGEIYDYPAVAIRPLLLEDDTLLKHYVAYYTRLFYDLTGKAPIISVRMNTSAASPYFVPTGRLISAWYDQAVQQGASSFYFWTRDYPTADSSDCYDGPIPGNTDPASLATERWESSLDVLGLLSTHQRFNPPEPTVAIFVPYSSALLHRDEWRQIYAAFSACCEAGIYVRFISDRQVEEKGIPEYIKMLLVPVIEFVSPALKDRLAAFASRGDQLYICDQPIFDEVGQPAQLFGGVVSIPADIFSFFPVNQPALTEAMLKASEYIKKEVEKHAISTHAWVYNVRVNNLPPTSKTYLRQTDSDVEFAHWLYEHGSDWITPYLQYDE